MSAVDGLTTPAGAVAQKDFQPANFLQQLLGSRTTTTENNNANIDPLNANISSMGNLSPEEMATLVQSLTAQSFNKNMAPVAAAMTSQMGARTAGNSGLQMAMAQMQQQAVQDAIAKSMEINTQRGQVRGQSAAAIANATKSSTATKTAGGAGGLDPTTAFLLNLGVNKLDKKFPSLFGSNPSTASAASAASADAISGPNPANAAGVAQAPNAINPETGEGYFSDIPTGNSTPSVGDGLFADVPNDIPDVPISNIPDVPDLSMYEDLPIDYLNFADGGSSTGSSQSGSSGASTPNINLDNIPGGHSANFRRDVEIEMQTTGVSYQAAADAVIKAYKNAPPPPPASSIDPLTGIDFFTSSKPSKPAGSSSSKTEVLQKGNRPKTPVQSFTDKLLDRLFADGGSDQSQSPAGGYNNEPSNSFMHFDQNAMYANGGKTTGGYPSGRVRPSFGSRNSDEPERRHDAYADGGAVNTAVRLGQPAFAYNPPNRAPSVRAPLPGDRGYAGFGVNAKHSVAGTSAVDTSWTDGFVEGYADGGITNDSHAPFGNTTNNFVSTLSKVITPYADGGTVRNRNYMGSPDTADVMSVAGPARYSSDAAMTATVRDRQPRQDDQGARDKAVAKVISAKGAEGVANYFTAGLGSSAYKAITGSKNGLGADSREAIDKYDPLASTAINSAEDATIWATNNIATPVLQGAEHAMGAVSDALSNGLSQPIGGGGLGLPDPGSIVSNIFGGLGFADGGNSMADGTDGTDGGLIKGPGTGTSDSIVGKSVVPGVPDIAVSTDEYIIPADVVASVGKSFFDNLLAAHHTPVRR